MSEKDWRQLFNLMEKVNSLPESVYGKGSVVVAAAVRLDADVVLEEFQSAVDLAWSDET